MKVLIASRSVAHYPYFASVAEALDGCGHEVVIGFDYRWSSQRDHYPVFQFVGRSKNGRALWLIRRSDKYRRSLFASREIRTYLTYKAQSAQSPYYKRRWEKYIPSWAKYLPSSMTGILSWYESKVPPDSKIINHLKALNPDVVLACPANHRFSEEIEYVKAANYLGILTVILNYSWDNLTTKGLYHMQPDLLLVWNEAQKRDALEIHGMDSMIVGAPFFDKWFDLTETPQSRTGFCKNWNIDPEKPYILYLGSSRKIAYDERPIIRELEKAGVQVLLRPHPANYRHYRLDNRLRVMEPELIHSKRSKKNFLTALRHSAFAFGINNSCMIDAIVNNKLCATVLFDGYKETQVLTKHFKQMKEALYVFGRFSQLVDTLPYLTKPNDLKDDYMRAFVKKKIKPYRPYFKSGEVIADVLEELSEIGKHSWNGQGQGACAC